MNNIFQLMAQYRQFMQNPQQYLKQMGIPADKMNNPSEAIQWLMNNGRVNQQMYNNAAQMAAQMKNQFQ